MVFTLESSLAAQKKPPQNNSLPDHDTMNTNRQTYRPGNRRVAQLQAVACCLAFAAIGVVLAL